MKKAKRKNAARRPDVRTGGEAPRPEGLDRVENADSPAAREAALAEDAAAATDTATTAVTELNDTDVLATVNGEEVSWDEVKSLYSSLVSQYGRAYDLTQQANVDLFRAVALENRLTEVLMEQKAKEFGVDQLTDEEIADLESQADTNWEDAIANYEAYFYPDLTEESSEEEKAAAREEAINYYKDQGYTLESLREEYKRYGVLNKIAKRFGAELRR